MDQYSAVPSGPISHSVELYTARLFIQGNISGPFKRTSDLINRRDRDFFAVTEAVMTPLGQAAATATKVPTPVIVRREHIHFAATAPQPIVQPGGQVAQSTVSPGREYFVQKIAHQCYALTDTFIIHGQCHLLQGTTLENLFTVQDIFVPITKATIYLMARPNAPWQRDLVVVNKTKLEALYLTEA